MKVSSARSNQWWFLTCPKVIAHANRLMDAAYHPSCFFLWPAPLSFDWSPHLKLTCGPAGNRTTTGSLSASSRTTPPTNYSTGTPCLSSILSCLSTSMLPYVPAFQALPRTKVKMTLKRGLDFMLFRPDTDIDSLDILLVMLLIEICIHWKRMKREQAQNTLPSLAKKFVAISKFRPLSVTFGFTF